MTSLLPLLTAISLFCPRETTPHSLSRGQLEYVEEECRVKAWKCIDKERRKHCAPEDKTEICKESVDYERCFRWQKKGNEG